MAEFFGVVRGNRGEASRTGTEKSGIRADLCSWKGRVTTIMEKIDGEIWVTIYTGMHQGYGKPNHVLREKLQDLMDGSWEKDE